MRSKFRVVLALAILLAITAVGWWLFGWSTEDNVALGVFTYQRFFARTTTVLLDSNRDGRPDARVSYSWNDPYEGIVDGVCVGSGTQMAEDRNFDGRWDVWTRNLGPASSQGCLIEFSVDTTGDGEADWSFRTTDSLQAYNDIAAKRGF
jgi:hypothetical protein